MADLSVSLLIVISSISQMDYVVSCISQMDYRRLDLNLLVVLDALLEERGVNATSRRLGISQPNVSFALAKLRSFFDDDLLVRQGNRMQPTPTGERLRDPVRRILATVDDELLRMPSFNPAVTERKFALSTSDIGELVFLPQLMDALAQRAPGATLRCFSMPPIELERAMADGVVDIALGYFPDLNGAAFYRQKLFEHPFVCLARAAHPQIGDSLALDQFLQLGHIVVTQEGRSQEIFEHRMEELRLSRRVQLQSPHFMSAPLLVAKSDLITTVPLAVGTAYAALLPLKLLELPIDIPPIELQQFWHRRVHHDPAVVWLRALIAELFLGRDPTRARGEIARSSPFSPGKRPRRSRMSPRT